MKKILSVFAALILLVTSSFALIRTSDFSDVPSHSWFYPYVMEIRDWGVIDGNDDGTFAPGNSINRAEFSKMLTRYDERVDKKIEEAIADSLDERIEALITEHLKQGSSSQVAEASSSVLPTIMYFRRKQGKNPPQCPGNWEEISFGDDGFGMVERVCLSNNACQVVYLDSKSASRLSSCPDDWQEADYASLAGDHLRRVCYICAE